MNHKPREASFPPIAIADLPPFSVGNTIQLVGAVYHGEGLLLLCPTPGEEECFAREMPLLLEMTTVEWDEFLRRTDLQEVEVSNGVQKAILRKTQRTIDANVSWNVFRRDRYACRYCGRDDVPLTVDHLVLWEEGGPSVEANLVSACKKCNKTRGNTPYAEWLHSDYCQEKARGLSMDVVLANAELVDALPDIRRVDRVRSR